VDGVPLTNLMHTYGTSGQRFLVGAEMTGSTHVQMQVAEILVYGEALTVAERNQVVDHLRAKYFDEFCSVPCLPPQIATDPLPDTLCIGDPLTVDVAATGTPPLFYQWSLDGVPIPGATSATYSVAGAALVDAGLYDVVVTNACGTATSAAVEVVVQSPLAVTLQPSAQSACPGSSPSFTVAATGSGPIFYQWRFNGTPIGGATAATLNLTNIAAGDVGNYDVVLTNPCGTATSVAVALSLLDPVAIQVQPVPQIGCLGSSVTMNVTATGTGLTYQWRKNGTPIAGATGSSFSLTNLTLSDADVYDVSVIGTCNTVNSSVVTVSVTTPASITTGPSPAVTCPGDNVMFSVTPAGSPPFFYEWRKDGAAIPGETGLTLTIPAATSGDSGDYTVVVSNSCGSQTSTPALLTVLADPAFDVVPGNTFACLGGTTNLTAAATGPAPLTFQWFKDGNPIPAATSTTLVLSPVVATDAGSYSIAVTSSCTTVTSQTFDVSVDSLPQIVTPPQPLTTCENFTTDFTVVADSVSPLTYQWRKNGFDIVGATTATYSIATTTPADAGSYDVVVTNACNFVTTLPVQLTVSPGTLCDCNMNGMLDSDDLATGASNDCNENGIPDECDIASGTSLDDDMNGIPDDCGFFDRGDCNIDSSFNIADVIFLLGFSFPGPLGPNDLQCKDACDCNDDGGLNIADAICFLGFLFGNPPIIPAAPFGACGVDPTDNDSLDCLEFPCP
ncbi:MAG: immunoglobulin domain-containing protein, partial [Planctomycetota bacterium]